MLTKNVKKLCEMNGLSIKELEKKCKLGSNTFYRWDRNLPSIDKVLRVAALFQVDVLNLCDDVELNTDRDTINFAREYYKLSEQQRNALKVYMSLINNTTTSEETVE